MINWARFTCGPLLNYIHQWSIKTHEREIHCKSYVIPLRPWSTIEKQNLEIGEPKFLQWTCRERWMKQQPCLLDAGMYYSDIKIFTVKRLAFNSLSSESAVFDVYFTICILLHPIISRYPIPLPLPFSFFLYNIHFNSAFSTTPDVSSTIRWFYRTYV